MSIQSFLFGGDTGETADSLARKRKVLDALLLRNAGPPKNVGEGLTALGDAIAFRMAKGDLATGEAAQKDRRDALMAPLFGSTAGVGDYVDPNVSASAVNIPSSGVGNELAGTGPSPTTAAAVPAFANDGTELGGFLSDPSRRSTLPAGMRNNNPGNIKFVGQKVPGIVGPSVNTDEGDPQAVFDTPESGMSAMYSLAKRKYDGGKRTPNQIIAGNMGWTPGNTQAAANVAHTMGISPDDDINMNDPAMAGKFMQALILQEHGPKGKLYPQAMISSVVGGGKPVEVASVNPSVSMAPAAAAIEAQAPGSGSVTPPTDQPPAFDPGRWGDPIKLAEMPASQADLPANLAAQANAYGASYPSASPVLSMSPPTSGAQTAPMSQVQATQSAAPSLSTTGQPLSDAQFNDRFSAPPAASPAVQSVAQALAAVPSKPPQYAPSVMAVGNALAAQNAAPPVTPPSMASAQPDAATLPAPQSVSAPPPVQVAANGAFPPAPPPPNMPSQASRQSNPGPSLQQLYRLASSPDITESDRGIVKVMIEKRMQDQAVRDRVILEQQLKQSDPAYQLGLEKARLETENLRNPRMLPADQARLDLEKNKFAYEQQKPTTNMREYDAYAADVKAAGRTPIGRMDYEVGVKKAGANNTTNILGGETNKFYEELDKKNADQFSTLSTSGMEARGKLARIDRLEGLMANAPQGALGALKQTAGDWGIPTEGLSDIQAASALLEKMVPEQRLPGSGTMSDGDIKMFRGSLPRIINQPGGNQLIFQTLRGIAQYEQGMGEIADRVANREINPAEGRRQIQELKNPLAEFKIPKGPTPNEGFIERPDLGHGVRIKRLD